VSQRAEFDLEGYKKQIPVAEDYPYSPLDHFILHGFDRGLPGYWRTSKGEPFVDEVLNDFN